MKKSRNIYKPYNIRAFKMQGIYGNCKETKRVALEDKIVHQACKIAFFLFYTKFQFIYIDQCKLYLILINLSINYLTSKNSKFLKYSKEMQIS